MKGKLMTEEQTTNPTPDDKKALARRWGIVGLGVALATAIVVKGFSDEDEELTEEELEDRIDELDEESEDAGFGVTTEEG